jgi:hypothetical protein
MKISARACMTIVFFFAFVAQTMAYDIPEAIYPAVAEVAVSSENFAPPGWVIEVLSKGDLNKDRLDDLLLVLKEDNPANLMTKEPDSPGMNEWDANPRILAIAFAVKKGGYKLVVQSNYFIPRHEDPCIDDPFAGAEIVDGSVKISLGFWANAGSWYTSSASFTFRYRDNAFRLVAYANYSTKRNTGETWDLKIDYVTREAEMTVGNFSGDEGDDEDGEKTYSKKLPRAPLMTFDDISFGFEFYPEQLDLSWWGIEERSF